MRAPSTCSITSNNCWLKCLLALLFFLFLCGCDYSFSLPWEQVHGSNYYVSPDGSDLNPGSVDKPWKTLAKAASTLIPGDTVYIHGGTYAETLKPRRSGAAGRPITYRDWAGTGEVIINAENASRDYDILVSGKSNLYFSGITVKGATGRFGVDGLRAGLIISNGANHITIDHINAHDNLYGIVLGESGILNFILPIKNVTITHSIASNNTGDGIFIYRRADHIVVGPGNHVFSNTWEGIADVANLNNFILSNDISIIGNEVDHNGRQGIWLSNTRNVLVQNNYSHHNTASGIQLENFVDHVIIDHNRCEYNGITPIYVSETGIWVHGSHNVIVQNNSLRDNLRGMDITDSDHVLVRRNLIFENNQGCLTKQCASMSFDIGWSSREVYFIHNTLFNNGRQGSDRGGLLNSCSYPTQKPISDVTVKNNIFSTTSASYDIWMDCAFYSDYNIFYNTRPLKIRASSTVSQTWQQYTSASQQDQHSLNVDPLFANISTFDFSLIASSPAIARGDFLTHTVGGGSGGTVTVQDANYFSDGFGMLPADQVVIGANPPAKIIKVDLAANTLTLDRAITWNANDPVSYPYLGAAPDMGVDDFPSLTRPTAQP